MSPSFSFFFCQVCWCQGDARGTHTLLGACSAPRLSFAYHFLISFRPTHRLPSHNSVGCLVCRGDAACACIDVDFVSCLLSLVFACRHHAHHVRQPAIALCHKGEKHNGSADENYQTVHNMSVTRVCFARRPNDGDYSLHGTYNQQEYGQGCFCIANCLPRTLYSTRMSPFLR